MIGSTNARVFTRWGLIAVILAIGIVGALFAMQRASAHTTGGFKLWDAVAVHSTDPATIATAPVEAFKSVKFDFAAGDTAKLSSTADGTGAILTDNFISVNGVNVCVGGETDANFVLAGHPVGTTNCFIFNPFPTLDDIPAFDITSAIPLGKSTVEFQWRDYGGDAETTDIYLVITSANPVVVFDEEHA